MDFTLTEEQELLRDSVRTLLAKECPPELVRAAVDDPAAPDVLWDRHLREWTALGDGPVVDLCLFVEELGAAMTPGPFVPTAVMFLPIAQAVDHPDSDRVLNGEVTGTVAMAGSNGLLEVTEDAVRTFVIDADRVDLVAFVLPGPSVLVVEAATCDWRRVETLDLTRRYFEVDLPSDRSGAVPIDAADLAAVVERTWIAQAAELVGVARWLVDASVSYARERVQFDKPIGSFQGLQWKLVDMALARERAAAATAFAAMAFDADDPGRHRAVHVAKAAAGEAARRAGRDGLQVHGGIGYTWEHDLHLYLRRAYTQAAMYGSSSWHHDRLADLLLD